MKSDSGYSKPSDNVLFRGKTQPLIYRMDSMKSGKKNNSASMIESYLKMILKLFSR